MKRLVEVRVFGSEERVSRVRNLLNGHRAAALAQALGVKQWIAPPVTLDNDTVHHY